MGFSSQVKDYLCEKTYEELGIGEREKVKWNTCCSHSFLYAVFLFSSIEEEGRCVVFSKRKELLEVTAYLLLREENETFSFSVGKMKNRGEVLIFPAGTREKILSCLSEIPHCNRCRILMVRAAFLHAGTLMDPQRGYHCAFQIPDEKASSELRSLLLDFGINAKIYKRNMKNYLYIKESSKIEDILSLIGAEKFSLLLMEYKIEKSIRSNINRKQNFDDANLKKTVDGAQSVIAAIHFLEKSEVLDTLPESLQNAAKLRLSYPEISLTELCQRSEEELTKSGLNHRLQKIVQLAEAIKKKGDSNE